MKLPEIGSLQQQINLFYNLCNHTVSDEQAYREAWGIKQACGFIKRKGRRGEVTTDTRQF